jgi:hypothetical protein
VIQLAFDRYLLPSTIRRQSYAVVDNFNKPIDILELRTVYDPVARTVTIGGPAGPGTAWLTPDQSYKLVLLTPQDPNSENGGFRAIDRAILADGQRREFVFRAGPPAGAPTNEAPSDFCADVAPIFFAKCDGQMCHGTYTTAAEGLVLTTAAGIEATAFDKVAHGANTGPQSASTSSVPLAFGVNMKLIERGDPGSSWLMYKLELAANSTLTVPRPKIDCFPPSGAPRIPPAAAPFTALAPATRTMPGDLERSILNELILGREMPYPAPPAAYTDPDPAKVYPVIPLTFEERERIRIWIANGAQTRDCGACEFL